MSPRLLSLLSSAVLSAVLCAVPAGCQHAKPAEEALPPAQKASLMEADRVISNGEDMKADGEKMKADGKDGADEQIRKGQEMIDQGMKMKQDAIAQ